mmetsp:Transcript_122073/g.380018  ORF Transcript_122073/g.380018 Transcript_122073/m.380018 type:complete len:318 (-) Transcript_122073:16-969(-)
MSPPVRRCDPKLLEKDLTGQVVIVTGANTGCGLETARQLASQGATVVLACRSKGKGEKAASEAKGVFLQCDLSDFDSVKGCAKAFLEKYDRLDMLINNGAVMCCPLQRTKEGYELQLATNHLGHFLLTMLLKDVLEKTKGRVINLSSVAASQMTMNMKFGHADIYWDDMQFANGKYDAQKAYSQSKLCNYLHAKEIQNRFSGVLAVSVHPGFVDTELHKYGIGNGCMRCMVRCMMKKGDGKGDLIEPSDGAQTTLHCALSEPGDLENGAFYSQKGIYMDKAAQPGGWPLPLPNPNVAPDYAARLWDHSLFLCGVGQM